MARERSRHSPGYPQAQQWPIKGCLWERSPGPPQIQQPPTEQYGNADVVRDTHDGEVLNLPTKDGRVNNA